MIANVESIPNVSLDEALALVDRLFAKRQLHDRAIREEDVLEYYRQSDRAYRMFHSAEGALHIGLSDDSGIDVGHARHAELFAEQLHEISACRAIEFGCGNGFNLRLLASQMHDTELLGVDLSEGHVRAANRDSQDLENLSFAVGNYQGLDVADQSFDAVLAVETLCQTADQSLALAEAFRILRPGGRMMVIDCFRNQELASFADDLQRAALLVEKTAAVDAFAVVEPWLEMAQSIGFCVNDCTNRSHETARDLKRLYQLARRFFRMSLAVKLIQRAMPQLALENSVCGLLMPFTVGHEVHGYYSIVLEKP